MAKFACFVVMLAAVASMAFTWKIEKHTRDIMMIPHLKDEAISIDSAGTLLAANRGKEQPSAKRVKKQDLTWICADTERLVQGPVNQRVRRCEWKQLSF